MEKIKLPTFKGKPLIESPTEIPQIGYLEEDFGEVFLEEFNGRVKSDYDNASALRVLSYGKDIVKGSNPPAVVLANKILKQKDLRTASQADLEKALRIGVLDLRGTYEDTSLVLRNADNPNEYLAKNLMEQIKARNKKQKLPVMITLNELELKIDKNSPHGLAFKLTDESEIIYAPILNKPGNFNSEDIDEKTGLPSRTGKGSRTLYTRDSGLSRLYLVTGLNVVANYDFLAVSVDDGRVVVVSAEGASPKNLDKYLSQLQSTRDAQIAEVEERYQKAVKVLNGKE